ncbi:MAG: porphobilinogen synthase [Saprospiraceae bacterium]|nr:porphobilinogen synthase [Saprospiraceae bacterium]
MGFPIIRKRINRSTGAIRDMVAETHLSAADFIAPVFVVEGSGKKEAIPSMPEYFRYSLDTLEEELNEIVELGIRAVLLFVKVEDELKDNTGKEALNPEGLMQRSIRLIKEKHPDLLVLTDVALDPYSSFGHDGIVEDGKIVNDKTVEVLTRMSLSHIEAGADWVAPSDMMDGRIDKIRKAFNDAGFHDKGILAYSAKYASHLYGPFRQALDSSPGFGDKKTYQMDYRNGREAISEALLDQEEGADMVMVKPGIFYLDVIRRLRQNCQIPVAVYQVSGEYAMIKAASERKWLDHDAIVLESLYAFKRAGASVIVTYFAKQACRLLNKM